MPESLIRTILVALALLIVMAAPARTDEFENVCESLSASTCVLPEGLAAQSPALVALINPLDLRRPNVSLLDSNGLLRNNLQFSGGASMGIPGNGALSITSVSDGMGLAEYRSLNLNSGRFSFSAATTRVDKDFAPIGSTSDSDIQRFTAARDTKRLDLNARMSLSDSTSISSEYFSTNSLSSDQFQRRLKNSLTIAPTNGPKLSLVSDQITSGTDEAQSNSSRQTVSLSDQIGTLSVSASYNSLTHTSPGSESSVRTSSLRLATDPAAASSVAINWTRSQSGVEQGDTTTQDYRINGRLFGAVNFSARDCDTSSYIETSTGSVNEYSLSSVRSAKLGPLDQITWNLRSSRTNNYTSEIDATVGRTDFSAVGHRFTFENIISRSSLGTEADTKSILMTGQPGLLKGVSYSLGYATRDMHDTGPSTSGARLNVGWRVSPALSASYEYSGCTDSPDGNLQPIRLSRLRLTQTNARGLSLTGSWETRRDYSQDTRAEGYSIALSGALSPTSTVDASYSSESSVGVGAGSSQIYGLSYNSRISNDHYLIFSANIRDRRGARTADPAVDDIQIRLACRSIFN